MQTERLLLIVVIIAVAILLVNTVVSWFKPSYEEALLEEYQKQTAALQRHVDSLTTVRAARIDTINRLEERRTTIEKWRGAEVRYVLAIMNKDSLVVVKDSLRHVLGWNPKLLEAEP